MVVGADLGGGVEAEVPFRFLTNSSQRGRHDVATKLQRLGIEVLPQLAKLKAGARVVCHANAIPGIRPERVVTVVSRDDDLPHKVYVYIAPLKTNDRPK